MQLKLKDIANIQFGHYAQPSKNGTIPYLQAKHFNASGQFTYNIDTLLEEDDKTADNLLQDGDILFVSKGFRFFATEYKIEFGKAVASSIFFVIKADKNKVIPAYLVSILNLPKNLLHFQQSGAGSSIPSIRKNELADFVVNLIPLHQQQKIVALQELYLKDLQLTENLIKQKQLLFQSTLSKILN
jgi:restriction endonuclease S subunit